MNIKNMPVANACACFSGTISRKLGSRVLRSLGAGGTFARWRCKDLKPDFCRSDACEPEIPPLPQPGN